MDATKSPKRCDVRRFRRANQERQARVGTPRIGRALKQRLTDLGPWAMTLNGFGEMLPNSQNRCTLNPEVVDAWGIPVLHIDCAWGPTELAIHKDVSAPSAEMLEQAGATNIQPSRRISTPGSTSASRKPSCPKAQSLEPSAVASPTITSPAHLRHGCGGQAMTQTGMILGTAAHMAPGQARGNRVDRRADLVGVRLRVVRDVQPSPTVRVPVSQALLAARTTHDRPDRPGG
ncbi:MAG: hypothetical protein OEW19_05920 [Acidobacteriota bacterium]|nr:hypothetical protein [Acidobacteriota bacterium]